MQGQGNLVANLLLPIRVLVITTVIILLFLSNISVSIFEVVFNISCGLIFFVFSYRSFLAARTYYICEEGVINIATGLFPWSSEPISIFRLSDFQVQQTIFQSLLGTASLWLILQDPVGTRHLQIMGRKSHLEDLKNNFFELQRRMRAVQSLRGYVTPY